MIGIYMIRNKENEKVYIGKSVNIFVRWQEHIKQSETATQYEDEFHFELGQNPEKFSFEILEICSEADLSKKEEVYMAVFNSKEVGYNKIFASTEQRQNKKISRSNKDLVERLNNVLGKPLFVEDKKKLANFFDYRDKRGNTLGWNTLKKHLIENGFEIIETKRRFNGKTRNCSVISVKYEY